MQLRPIVGRRRLLACALLWSAVLAGLLAPGAVRDARAAAGAADTARPNVIVFLTDDMRKDELAYLPHVRRWLIKRGATFTHAFSADSICCPARATLLTGKEAHNHRTLGNSASSYGGAAYFYRYNRPEDLLPAWLQDGGYKTAWIGKLLNQRRGHQPDPNWNYWNVPLHGSLYHYNDGWTTSINGKRVTYPPGVYREKQMRTDLLNRVRRWEAGTRPYFIMAAHLAPHTGKSDDGASIRPVPAKRYRNTVDRGALPKPPATEETDRSDKPSWIQTARVSGFLRYHAARRIEALRSVDDTVGAVARELASTGQLDNTLMIFTSDNGYLLGEHKYSGKNVPYEESIGIPLVIAGPGFTPGSRVDQMVSLADVTSTIRRAAGIAPKDVEDGLPLQDFAQAAAYEPERPILLEGSTAIITDYTFPVDEIGRFYTGVRWQDYVYTEYQNGPREFYDLSRDPYELDNAYVPPDDPERRPTAVQVRLAAWLAAHKDCVGSAACNEPVPALIQ